MIDLAGEIGTALAPLAAEVRGLRADVAAMRAELAAQASRWVSRAEAAQALGVSLDTLDKRIASGDGTLRVRRLGRAVRVLVLPPPTDVEIAQLAAAVARPSRPEKVKELANEARA